MNTNNVKFSDVRAVVFDKDGTLIDFDAFWVSVSKRAIDIIFDKVGFSGGSDAVEEILVGFGVREGVTDIDGILCKGTYRQMSDIVHAVLFNRGFDTDADTLYKTLLDAYSEADEYGEVLPTCAGLKETLLELRSAGIALFVVTTDNLPITKKCLNKLGVYELFDRIYCDDGIIPTKPDVAAAADICNRLGIGGDRIIMVGDTMTDVLFARAGGLHAVSVSSSEVARARLSGEAELVISNVSELLGYIER